MDSRERFLAVMHYGAPDRGMYLMPWFGFPETLEKWKEEAGFKLGDLSRYKTDQWVYSYDLFYPQPPFEHRVLEEDERHVVYMNHEGIVLRELKHNPTSSMPQFVRFPVETREDFRRFAKERLQPDLVQRIGPNWPDLLATWRKYPRTYGVKDPEKLRRLKGNQPADEEYSWIHRPQDNAEPAPFWLYADRWGGFFGPLRNLVGVQDACCLFYTDPAFAEEILDTIADFVIAMVGQILDHIEIEVFAFWEDMCFNQGPLVGPDVVRRYLAPRYRRVIEFLRGRGVKLIALDCDGRIDSLIPIWLDAGVNLLFPMEVQAGMDVVQVRREYGRELRMYGGIDKRPLARDHAAIDREIARVMPVIEDGGYAAIPDHSIPPDVPLEHFDYYMRRMGQALVVV